jgi:hypothetical protein
MKNIYIAFIGLSLWLGINSHTMAQSLPVGTVGIEDYYRREQLLGKLDSTISFSIRPLFPTASLKIDDVFDPDSTLKHDGYFKGSGPVHFANGLGMLQILPLSWQQQYNSHHPYGWNDGAMVPARGYQTMVSGGFFAKFGPLSIQLRPEYVYAENKAFEGYATYRSDKEITGYYAYYNLIDAPERFGNSTYSKLNWGQSSIRLTVGPASLGLSNENIWWGPGVQNSLMMTNNATGFKHLTLNSVKPIRTPIGSFEGQLIAGRLEESGFEMMSQSSLSTGENVSRPFNSDWRYLAGVNISYQPKWVPGLFVGFIRDFMSYSEDITGFKDYFPFFFPVQKKTTGSGGDPYERDQRISMYGRWIFTKAKAELYFEYGLNDNSYNYRDFIGNPEHSRAYVFGFTKMLPLKYKKDQYIQINGEIDQLSQSTDRLVRPAGSFYQHYQVRQGYTNLGEVLGAGIGTGGNLQSIKVSWLHGLKSIGIGFERYEHNTDFYNDEIQDLNGQSRRWVDFALATNGYWNYKNLIFSAKLQAIKSLNYQWIMKNYTPDEYYIPQNDVINFHGELGMSFRF